MNKIKTFFMLTLIGIGGSRQAIEMYDCWENAEDSNDDDLINLKKMVANFHPLGQLAYSIVMLIVAFITWPIGLMILLLDILG